LEVVVLRVEGVRREERGRRREEGGGRREEGEVGRGGGEEEGKRLYERRSRRVERVRVRKEQRSK